MTHAILQIDSEQALRAAVQLNQVNWSQLSKIRSRGESWPLFALLAPFSGRSMSEQAWRCCYPDPGCASCRQRPCQFYNWKRGYSRFCSRACAGACAELQSSNLVKRSRTMQSRWGAATTLQSPALRERMHATMVEKYGAASAQQVPEIQEQTRRTVSARYGATSPAKNSQVAARISDSSRARTWKRRLQSLSPQLEYVDARAFDGDAEREWRCRACDLRFTHCWNSTQRAPICRACNPMLKGTSAAEQQLCDWVASHTTATVKRNHRFYFDGGYYELDVYIPELNFGIEFNGLYWHSELAGRDRMYHAKKKKFFDSLSIRTLFIFEHEWVQRRAICESMILHKMGLSTQRVSARRCRVVSPSRDQVREFLDANHIAGWADYTLVTALAAEGALVAVATFRPDRFGSDKTVLELVRFCTRRGHSVPGALARCVSQAQRIKPQRIKTFCDLRWGTGAGYLKSGFVCDKITLPCCWYFDRHGAVYHRSRFQKRRLLELHGLSSSPLTEWQLAQELHLNRFWDCGNLILYKDAP